MSHMTALASAHAAISATIPAAQTTPVTVTLPDCGNFEMIFVRTTFHSGNPRTERETLTVLQAVNVQPNVDSALAQGWTLESINFW